MKTYVIIFIGVLIFLSCRIYSVPNSSPFIHQPTVSIGDIKNNVLTPDPNLNFELKEKLENRFRLNSFNLVDKDGDLKIVGEIADYKVEPVSIGPNNIVYLNRVTLKVKIEWTNLIWDNRKRNEPISDFVDFEGSKNLATIRDSINNLLAIRLADRIFDQITNRW